MAPEATDPVLAQIADYVTAPPAFGDRAYDTARLSLLDSLGCALLALEAPECRRLLGPPAGADGHSGPVRVPGTGLRLDPVSAAFNIGAMIRWLDYNDTWLAAEWGHPSDNLGALLALADARCRAPAGARSLSDWRASGRSDRTPNGRRDWAESDAARRRFRGATGAGATGAMTVRDLLHAQIQAYEIQGVLALENAFNRLGLDHVLLVRVASAAVATRLLGGDAERVVAALSHAFLDGGALRTYRHGATTGSRKSWAAGDATSRGLWLAYLVQRGEMGYPAALSAARWGFQDVVLRGEELRLGRPLGSYVVENVLFKVAFPAEFHGQTAVEAAFALHPHVAGRLEEVAAVEVSTQESAVRIIDKRGPLTSPADRDHCLQYMVAVALLHGELRSEHYRDAAAADPRIERLRHLTTVREEPRFTRDYLDPAKRAIGNRVQVRFKDGSATPPVEVAYPLGHPRRRAEALPELRAKFAAGVGARFTPAAAEAIERLWDDPERTDRLRVDQLLDCFTAELADGGDTLH